MKVDDVLALLLLGAAVIGFSGGVAVGSYLAHLDRPAIIDVSRECLP